MASLGLLEATMIHVKYDTAISPLTIVLLGVGVEEEFFIL